MRYFRLTVLLSILLTIPGFSQINTSIDSSYTKYFEKAREIPYLHLNKTHFIKGEEVWFQAYILEPNSKKPHPNTSNLYVTIFDGNGTIVKQKLIKITKGFGSGNILIDSSFVHQNYFVKAHTNWMRNFKENQSFVQQIKVVDNKEDNIAIDGNTSYDFQVFPEGGHLLEDTKNTLGILIKDSNNFGIQTTGVIKNKLGKVVREFSTNKFGLGKTDLLYEVEESYIAELTLSDGTILSKKLPPALKNGVALSVDNQNKFFISINLNTNEASLKNLAGKTYRIFIHNTSSFYSFDHTLNLENNFVVLSLKRQKIPKGTNIVTILNENGLPVLERVIFNYHKDLFTNVTLKDVVINQDSVYVNLEPDSKNITTLSASILPKKSIAYKPSNTIYSSFLLKPYIKGKVENSSYYFNDVSWKKLMELDMLLLTQGWSKYDWNDIYNFKSVKHYEFENGIPLNGVLVNQKIKDSTNIFLHSKESNIIALSKIINNKFKFNGLDLKNNSTYKLTLARQRLKKPKVVINSTPVDNITFNPKVINEFVSINSVFKIDTVSQANMKGFISKNTTLLDTVTLKSTKKERLSPKINRSFSKIVDTKNVIGKTQNILDYIRANGFMVIENGLNNINVFNRRASRLMGSATYANVYVDDIQIASEFAERPNNLDMIKFLRVIDFEKISISKFGNGEIRLYSNKDTKPWNANKFHEGVVDFGYAINKEYYHPKYASEQNEQFENYGAIHWIANLTLNTEQGNQKITFPKPKLDAVRIFIEGITSDGKLISVEKDISFKKRN